MAKLRSAGTLRRVAVPLLAAVCILLPGCPPPNGTEDPPDEPIPVAVYWAQYNDISCKAMSFSGPTFVSPDAGTAGGIAVDPVGEKVYWTDREAGGTGNGGVRRCGLDGSSPETLLTGLVEPGQLAIDAAGGKMYWAAQARIQRANLDGSAPEPNYMTAAGFETLSKPTGIALDDSDPPVLYFAWLNPASGDHEIWRAPVDSPGSSEAFLTDLPETGGIDAGGGWVYWTTLAGDLYRAPDYGGPETVECVLDDVETLEDVALDLPNRDVYICTSGFLDHEDMTNTIYPSIFAAPLDGAPSPMFLIRDTSFPAAERTHVIALYWPPE